MRWLIAGSNLISLLAALKCKLSNPNDEVMLVDRSLNFGANMKSKKMFGFYYDIGMQTFYETGLPGVDSVVHQVLDEANLPCSILTWPYHDNCGIVFDGNLKTNCPYLDISEFTNHSEIEAKVRSNIGSYEQVQDRTFSDFLKNRFGMDKSHHVIDALLKKYNLTDNKEQSAAFAQTLPMDRVYSNRVSDDELKSNPELRKFFAFNLKAELEKITVSNRKTLYPTEGGIETFFAAHLDYGKKIGIQFNPGATISYDEKSNAVTFFDNDGLELFYDALIWGGGLNFFDVSNLSSKYLSESPAPLNGAIVHILAEKPLENFDLQYFFDVSSEYVNRVTFYGGMTQQDPDYCRATIEFIGMPDNPTEYVINYLKKHSILADCKLSISKPEKLPWPLYLPVGIERLHNELSNRAKTVERMQHLICSDASEGSLLMGATMKRVFTNLNF